MIYGGGAAPAINWQITNVELELCIIELSDVGMAMVNSVTPFNQPIYLHGNSWRHYTSSLNASTSGTYSTLVPARFASLKSLVCLPRRATEISNYAAYSLSSRANPQILSYYFRVGPYFIPNKPVNLINTSNVGGFSEAYMEVICSFHAMSHADPGGTIGFDQYNTSDIQNDANIGSTGITAVTTYYTPHNTVTEEGVERAHNHFN